MAHNQPKIYRQKNVKRIILRILLCILIAIFIFAFIALLGFRKYISYSETGKLYLDIPWLYEYMDGEPETDDLAQYLTPSEKQEPAQTSTKPDVSPENTGSENPEETVSNEPPGDETTNSQENP